MKLVPTLCAFALSLFIIGCSSTKTDTVPDDKADKTVETPKADMIAIYKAGADKFTANTMDGAEFSDSVSLVGATMTAEGKEEATKAMAGFKAPFPDMKVKSARVYVLSDDMIAVEGVSNGTHTEPMGEMAATGKPVGGNYLHLVWFEGEKIKRIELMSNPVTTLQQVGAAPSPNDTPPAVPELPAETEIIKGEASTDNEAVATAYFGAATSGDMEKLKTLVSADYKLIHHGSNMTLTFEQANERMKQIGAGLTEVTMVPEAVYSVGDWVIARVPFTAKHTGEFMGMPATNKMVSTPTYNVLKIVDGKVVQNTEYMNGMHFSAQLKPDTQSAK